MIQIQAKTELPYDDGRWYNLRRWDPEYRNSPRIKQLEAIRIRV